MRRPRLIVAAARGVARRRRLAFLEAGWEVWELPGRGGHVSLPALLARAAEEGFLRIFAEAGPTLAGALLAADLVDELSLYVAPIVLGGRKVWPDEASLKHGGELRFEHVDQRRTGEDLRLGLRRRGLVERLVAGAVRASN